MRPDGSQSVFAHFDTSGTAAVGLAFTPDGTMYAAVPAANVASGQTDPAGRGVYRIGRDGTPVRVPGTEAMIFPNDLRSDERGTVYATDSVGGSVWRIPRNGPARLWVHDPLLEGTGAAGAGFPLGANGIAVVQGAVIVAAALTVRPGRPRCGPSNTTSPGCCSRWPRAGPARAADSCS
jgi:hypothetical protein